MHDELGIPVVGYDQHHEPGDAAVVEKVFPIVRASPAAAQPEQIFPNIWATFRANISQILIPSSEQIFQEYLLNQSKYLNCEMSNQTKHIKGQISYPENLEYWEFLIKNIIWQIPSLEFLYITG